MYVRVNHIHFWKGQQLFAIRPITVEGAVRFVGTLNGRDCGHWLTKEAAVQALLRRAAHETAH
jgi:hypothetical protein